jgi:hypothetical protein
MQYKDRLKSAMANLGAIRLFIVAPVLLPAGAAQADRIVSVNVEGMQFKVTLESGRLLDSMGLVGAMLDLALPGDHQARCGKRLSGQFAGRSPRPSPLIGVGIIE